jgi:hypothetical protein
MKPVLKAALAGGIIGAVVNGMRTGTLGGAGTGAIVGTEATALVYMILSELRIMRANGRIPKNTSDTVLSDLADEIESIIRNRYEDRA